MSSQDDISRISDSITSILNNENYLLNRLHSLKSSPTMHQVEINNIKNRLQELQTSREALMNLLSKAYDENSEELDGNKTIKNKAMIISLLNEEVNQMKHNLNAMNQTKLNKKRLVQIYNYEKSKYYAKIEVLKLIAYTMLAVLFVFILQRLKILSPTIAMGLASVIIAVGIIYVLYKMYDITIRDPLHFDKYIQSIDTNLIEKEAKASYNAENDVVSDDEQIANLSANKCGKVSDNAAPVTMT